MTLATTVTNQAKTVKNSGSSFGPPNYEMPKLDMPKMEVPPAFRELADKGVAQARDTYEKAEGGHRASNEPAQRGLYDRRQGRHRLQH